MEEAALDVAEAVEVAAAAAAAVVEVEVDVRRSVVYLMPLMIVIWYAF